MKKKKKNRNQLHIKRMQDFLAGNVRMYRWESQYDPNELDDRTYVILESRRSPMMKNYARLHNSKVSSMAAHPLSWMLCCRALCTTDVTAPNADIWIETEMRAWDRVGLSNFSAIYFEMRDAVLSQVQTRHVVDLGWICHTRHPRIDLDGEWYRAGEGDITLDRQNKWNQSESMVAVRMARLAA